MDNSSPACTRRPSLWIPPTIEHAQADPRFSNLAKEARARLQAAADAERERQIIEAYDEGRTHGSTDSWIAGAKLGAFCGGLFGLAVGVCGSIYFVGLGRLAG